MKPGSVCICFGRRFLVAAMDGGNALTLSIHYHNISRRRGDLVVTDIAVLHAMGLHGGRWIARLYDAAVAPLHRGARHIGTAPDDLMRQVEQALRREAMTRAEDQRRGVWSGEAPRAGSWPT